MDCLKGAAAGAAGGLLGGWIMNGVQGAISGIRRPHGGQSARTGGGFVTRSERRFPSRRRDDSATKTAAAIAEIAGDEELTAPERERAGGALHYGFATAAGAAWGALAACTGIGGAAAGALYGAAVWFGANALVLPALGLSKRPHRYAPSVEAASVTGHLAWGLTTELVRLVLTPGDASVGERRLLPQHR